MTTAIIGIGKIGGAVARHLVAGGEPVVLAAKEESNAEALAGEIGPLARAASVEDAIAAPRWVLGSGVLLAEDGLPFAEAVDGVPVQPMPVADLAGHAHAIAIEPDGLRAACDPRADGVPIGE